MAHSLAMATSLPKQPLSQAPDPGDSALQAESGDRGVHDLAAFRRFHGDSAGSVSHPSWWRGIHSAFWVRTTYPHPFLCRALFGVHVLAKDGSSPSCSGDSQTSSLEMWKAAPFSGSPSLLVNLLRPGGSKAGW
ncbi:hypothetical protein J1605_016850 [Eschrichtius robustus]|uniref:Uncharacterized protein n=1 Tax=Eschrichtius robustus TaxID=9764 RepID=A0AB34I4I1_ESCRO|nr:hypothetical protein J1605_016850 [Eschrichtius robustus]